MKLENFFSNFPLPSAQDIAFQPCSHAYSSFQKFSNDLPRLIRWFKRLINLQHLKISRELNRIKLLKKFVLHMITEFCFLYLYNLLKVLSLQQQISSVPAKLSAMAFVRLTS